MADPAPPGPSRAVLIARLGTGLVQGLALFALSRLDGAGPEDGTAVRDWVSANPQGLGLLILLASLLPLPILLGLGHLRGRVLWGWAAAAAGLILLLGGNAFRENNLAGWFVAPSLGALLFVGQSLVTAADAGRRWWPRYTDCFEAAWRALLQLALAACFVAGFWLVYWIGARLFSGIGLEGLRWLSGGLAFVLPVTTTLGAAGIHLADAGDRLTSGLRSLLLALKAWLTPLAAGLAAAFLLSLPFTGLDVLWRREGTPYWLTAAAAGLVVLVSAVHGDGRQAPPAALRLSARLGAAVLPALVALSGWGLWRTVDARGLTEGRVIGAALLALLAFYAVAYLAAARRPDMRGLEPANTAGAMLTMLVLFALNTPLIDPIRLEVRSQTGRLLRGEVAPAGFDFRRLARAGRDGKESLAALARHPDPEIARRAGAAEADPYGEAEPAADAPLPPPPPPRLRALPEGTALPAGLRDALEEMRPDCGEEDCLVRMVPLDGEETWLVGPALGEFWAMRPAGDGWRRAALYRTSYACQGEARTRFLDGSLRPAPPRLPEIAAGKARLVPFPAEDGCQ